jgi:hypothetical protein
MNNIRRFRYVKPIYKKSVILNNRLIINYLKLYKQSAYALVNNNKKSYSNLVSYNKPESELVLYLRLPYANAHRRKIHNRCYIKAQINESGTGTPVYERTRAPHSQYTRYEGANKPNRD